MIIAVLSDTHLTSLNEDFCRRVEGLAQEVDLFFHLGDAVAKDVLDFLNSFTLYAVSGNMDPPEIRSAWPDKRVVELDGFRFGLTHGWGSPFGLDKRVFNQMQGVDCVCFGHSHRPLNKRQGDVLLFNPGAARSGFMSGSSYGRLTVGPEGISGQHLPF